MAGLKVVLVKVQDDGNLDIQDLRSKAEKHKDKLAAFMVRDLGRILSLLLIPFRSRIPPLSAFSKTAYKK